MIKETSVSLAERICLNKFGSVQKHFEATKGSQNEMRNLRETWQDIGQNIRQNNVLETMVIFFKK